MCRKVVITFKCGHKWEPPAGRSICKRAREPGHSLKTTKSRELFTVCSACLHQRALKWQNRIGCCSQALDHATWEAYELNGTVENQENAWRLHERLRKTRKQMDKDWNKLSRRLFRLEAKWDKKWSSWEAGWDKEHALLKAKFDIERARLEAKWERECARLDGKYARCACTAAELE